MTARVEKRIGPSRDVRQAYCSAPAGRKLPLQPGEMITVDFSPAKDGSKTGLVARVTKADGTILANAGRRINDHRRTVIFKAAVLLSLAAWVVSASGATPPDFSGVYYPINPFGPPPPAGRAGGPPGADTGKQTGKQKGPPPASHPVGAARRWLAGPRAGRAFAYTRVHGEVGSDQ